MQIKTKFSKIFYWILVILVLLFCAFILFNNLGAEPVKLWDEARRAVRAYEMYKNGLGIVTTYEQLPDMWGTKPPLLIWLQTLSFHAFGVSTFALRVPSALSGFFCCMILLIIWGSFRGTHLRGIFSALILISTYGFVGYHSARTGDFDALLSLWVFAAASSFYFYFERRESWQLLLFFFFLSLACLTKGVAGLFILPGLAVFVFIQNGFLKKLLLTRSFYFGVLMFLAIVFGFYFGRELLNPGYLQAVWENELGGRYLEANEEHKQDVLFYIRGMMNYRFQWWFWLLPAALVAVFLIKREKDRQLLTFLMLLSTSILLVISTAETKLRWYDVSVYPFLALVAGTLLSLLFNYLQKMRQWYACAFGLAFLVYFIFFPARDSWIRSTHIAFSDDFKQTNAMVFYLQEIIDGKRSLEEGCNLAYYEYGADVKFQVIQLKERGYDLNFVHENDLESGQCLLIQHELALKAIDEVGDYEIIEEFAGIKKVQLQSNTN